MNRFFFSEDHRLRNGWWALFFVVALALFGFAQAGIQWLCKKAHIPGGPWVQALGALAILGATWTLVKLRKEPLSSVGFQLDGRWIKEFGWGSAIGIGQMLLAAFMVWGVGGVRLELNPDRSLQALASGLILFLFVSIKEETLFRGFLFQRLRDGMGVWPTQILLAAFFAIAHWANPGMHGATKFWATLDIGVGAVVFGLAYLRTNSLALPIGLHLGWNWMQGHVLGFGVSGLRTQGWLHPVFLGKPEWLTGGSFGLEASLFAVVVDVTLLCALLAWKGSVPQPSEAPEGTSAKAALAV